MIRQLFANGTSEASGTRPILEVKNGYNTLDPWEWHRILRIKASVNGARTQSGRNSFKHIKSIASVKRKGQGQATGIKQHLEINGVDGDARRCAIVRNAKGLKKN